MNINPNLIQKFLDNRCTADEAGHVASYLKKHPELITTYLKSAWNDAGEENSPEGYDEEMWEIIYTKIVRGNRIIRFRWATAAALLLILGASVWLASPGIKTHLPNLTAMDEKKVHPVWKEVANIRSKASIVRLEDSSMVTLAPNSIIRYQEPFGKQEQRVIYLVGEANFSVAHDKAKPFTVHTKLFSTIALGTSFIVSQSARSFTVRLFEGKVLITSALNQLNGWKKDTVLLPGNEMKYSFKAGTVAVSRFITLVRTLPRAYHSENMNRNKGTLIFNNTALADVMKTLDAACHYHILYDEKVLAGKYFSGEAGNKDSLSTLLQVIANMNGLRVIKNEENYVITESR